MSKFLKMGDKQVEFLEEVKEVLRYNNLVVVLYRKDKELPIAECEIGIIYEIDLDKKEVLNKEFIC